MDISLFKSCKIMVIGDLMIDEYLWGEVDRISPEAPVPVVSVTRENFTLGGAGNVVNNLAALGAEVTTIGVAGTGEDGRRLVDLFERRGLDVSGIVRTPTRPTTRKTRIIAGSQHVLRIDRESRQKIPEEIVGKIIQRIRDQMETVDAVLVSDYGKGLISASLMTAVVETAAFWAKPVVTDPKGLDFGKYKDVFLLTPNQKEAAMAAGMEIEDDASLDTAGRKILSVSGAKHLLITRGKEGMALFVPGQPTFKIRSQARQVFDVSGAGDTVVAVLGLVLAAGGDLKQAAATANTAAGIVVGKVGTATVTREELQAAQDGNQSSLPAKSKTVPEMADIAGTLKQQGKRIVFTNGCFDLIHGGHISLFAESKALGDVLVVAIDDDESVRALKGKGRPVIGAEERVRILNALDVVDYVVVFKSGQLESLIKAVQPDILTKGSNFSADQVKFRTLVEKLGGSVALIPITSDASATKIIEDIKRS